MSGVKFCTDWVSKLSQYCVLLTQICEIFYTIWQPCSLLYTVFRPYIKTLHVLNMLTSVIFFNFRNRNFNIEISFVWLPPLAFFISCLRARVFFFASHLRLVLTIKTFSTHSKANYNKLETQNGGGGSASFGESVWNALNLWKCQICAFYGLWSISLNW